MILGARAPVCLEWARAFHAAGAYVTVADSVAWPLARASAAVQRYVRLPEPRYATNDWLDAIAAEIERDEIDFVLPTCEEVFYLAHGMARLPARCRVFTSDVALLRKLHHKGHFAQLTAGWPVAAPETRLLESVADVERLYAESADWVFKPAFSRFASATLIAPSIRRIRTVRPTVAEPWVAQRFVRGREHCTFSVFVDGHPTITAAYHPRYRVGTGSGIFFEPTSPPQLPQFLERFGAVTGYTGQAGFDFIEDESGRLHVLECNPRATSGIHLLGDRPLDLVAALSGARDATAVPAERAQSIALAMLFFAAPRALLRGEFRAFARDYGAAADAIVRDGDLGPLIAQVPGFIEIALRAVRRRCSLLAAATADIEWNGQPLEAPVA
jgi:predicted ATP-grasp superfamily ATP-dependent carboligase